MRLCVCACAWSILLRRGTMRERAWTREIYQELANRVRVVRKVFAQPGQRLGIRNGFGTGVGVAQPLLRVAAPHGFTLGELGNQVEGPRELKACLAQLDAAGGVQRGSVVAVPRGAHRVEAFERE